MYGAMVGMTPTATLPRRLHLAQNGTRVGQKGATGFGEADATAQAIEELRAQVFLKLENLL
jgi:hypothetical protein